MAPLNPTPTGPPSLALSVGTSALAPALAGVVTNPADVAKTRLNMMLELQPGSVRLGVLQCLRQISNGKPQKLLQRRGNEDLLGLDRSELSGLYS